MVVVDVREDSEVCGPAVKTGARRKRDTQPAVNVTAVPQDVLLTIVNLNYTQAGVAHVRMVAINHNVVVVKKKTIGERNAWLDYLTFPIILSRRHILIFVEFS